MSSRWYCVQRFRIAALCLMLQDKSLQLKSSTKKFVQKLTEVIAIRQAVSSLRGLLEVSEWLSAAEALSHARVLHSTCIGAKSLSCLVPVPLELDQLQEQLSKSVLQAIGDAAAFKGMDEVTLSCCHELQVCWTMATIPKQRYNLTGLCFDCVHDTMSFGDGHAH